MNAGRPGVAAGKTRFTTRLRQPRRQLAAPSAESNDRLRVGEKTRPRGDISARSPPRKPVVLGTFFRRDRERPPTPSATARASWVSSSCEGFQPWHFLALFGTYLALISKKSPSLALVFLTRGPGSPGQRSNVKQREMGLAQTQVTLLDIVRAHRAGWLSVGWV